MSETTEVCRVGDRIMCSFEFVKLMQDQEANGAYMVVRVKEIRREPTGFVMLVMERIPEEEESHPQLRA